MLKLLYKTFALSIIVLGICYSSLYLNPKYDYHYLSSIKLKLDKLEKIQGNKVVILGGSNACFGIDSDLMENSLGMPVVNTALHAALGPNFWIEYVKDNLNQGDIVIMSPEYGMLSKKGWYGTKSTTVPITILYTPSKLYILFTDYTFFKKNVVRLFETIKSYWKEYPFEPYTTQGTYDIRSFEGDNIKGDFINSIYEGIETKKILNFNEKNISWKELREAKRHFENERIKFYITLPSALDESFDVEKTKDFIRTVSEYSTVPILNNNLDYFFSRENFFDTEYHLNKKGRELRTKKLIDDLNKELQWDNNKVKTNNVFISKSNYQSVSLDKLKMAFKINQQRFGKDSVILSPETLDKLGFLKYKTEKTDYSGYLVKITVRGKKEVIEKLKFRSAKDYDFDYVQDYNNDTFTLCKVLSNVIHISEDNQGNGFSSIGIGFNKGDLLLTDKFTVTKFELIKTNVSCERASSNVVQDEYSVENSVESMVFKFKNFRNKEFRIKDIVNLECDQILVSGNKYLIQRDSEKITLIDFYKRTKIWEEEFKKELKFYNNEEYQLEINH